MDVTPAELRYASHHMMYNEEFKLVFCTIPKVACTEWLRMFYKMQGDPKWHLDPHYRGNKPQFNKLPPQRATEILNDPNWTKAVFFRDPARRLLSAYLDKFVYQGSYAVRVYNEPKATRFTCAATTRARARRVASRASRG